MAELRENKIFRTLEGRRDARSEYYMSFVRPLAYDMTSFLENIKNLFSHYPDHGIQHSIRILDNLASIISPEMMDYLSSLDLFVLIYAALLHDTGMALFNSNEIDPEVLRKQHATEAAKVISQYFEKGIPLLNEKDRIQNAVVFVCEAHGFTLEKLVLDPRFQIVDTVDMLDIHYGILAFLLRIGDLMDMEASRVNNFRMAMFRDTISGYSWEHNERHQNIVYYLHNIKTIKIKVKAKNDTQVQIWKDWLSYLKNDIEKFNSLFTLERLSFPIPEIEIEEVKSKNNDDQAKQNKKDILFIDQQELFYAGTEYFTGREKLVDEIVAEMRAADTPVIVVHGVAGIGKTEACKAAYRQIKEDNPSFSMAFIDLNGVDSVSEFCDRIAKAINASYIDGSSEDKESLLCNHIRTISHSHKKDFFAYLDNFEDAWDHLHENEQKELADKIIQLSHFGLRFLISSQVLLTNFKTIPIKPLDGNKNIKELSQDKILELDSARLFINVLGRELRASEYPAFIQLMEELSGHPLSIILAANYGRIVGNLITVLKRWTKIKTHLPNNPESHDSLTNALTMTWKSLQRHKAAALRWAFHSLSCFSLDTQMLEELNMLLSTPFTSDDWDKGEELLNKYGLADYDDNGLETMLLAVKKSFLDFGGSAIRVALPAWTTWLSQLMKEGDNCKLSNHLDRHHRALEWLPEFFFLAEICAENHYYDELAKLLESGENYYSFDTAQSISFLERMIIKTPEHFQLRGSLLKSWGDMLKKLGRNAEAKKAYEEAEQIYKKDGNNHGLAQVFYQQGIIKENEGRLAEIDEKHQLLDEAKNLFDNSITLFEKEENDVELAYAYLSRSILAEKQSQDDLSEEYYKKAEDIFLQHNDRLGLAHMKQTHGVSMERKKNYNQALRDYSEAAEIFYIEWDYHSLANVLNSKAKVYIKQEVPDWGKAYECNVTALQHFQNQKDIIRQCSAMILLIECCKHLGKEKEAQEYIKAIGKLIPEAPKSKQSDLRRKLRNVEDLPFVKKDTVDFYVSPEDRKADNENTANNSLSLGKIRTVLFFALAQEFAAFKNLLPMSWELDAKYEEALKMRGHIGIVEGYDHKEHQVGLFLLPEYGNNMAGIYVTKVMSLFSAVEHIIMCGIAGGIPEKEHIGDVIISTDGVYQYDYGENGIEKFITTDPGMPCSLRLKQAVKEFQAELYSTPISWNLFFNSLKGKIQETFITPPRIESYYEFDDSDNKYINRTRDSSTTPKLLYGRIGSANCIQKNPAKRDQLYKEERVLAIEMEAGGIKDSTRVENKGFLVVRGICDFCDDNESEEFHDYASMTAAIYTYSLLRSMPDF